MPIDPDISLQVNPGGGQAGANPLGTLGQFANIQNSLNQNRLFQQTFQARIQAGQIMSAAPDIETGFNQMLKDPQVAPFAGEMINMYRQSQLAQVQMQGEQQNQAQGALTYAQKLALPSSLANPAALDPNLTAALRITSPGVQGRVLGAVNDIRTSLLDGLPSNPSSWTPQQFQTYTQRVTAQSLATGTPIDVVHGVIGNPVQLDTGGGIVGGVQQAPQYGGALSLGGPVVGKTLPPTLVTGPYGGGGATVPLVAGGALGTAASPLTGGNTGGTPSPNSGNSLLPAAPSPAPISGPTQGQAAANVDLAKSGSDYKTSLDSTTQAAGRLLQNISEARNALQSFKAGGGASTYAKIAQVAQAFGASPALVNQIGNGDYSATQEFQKLMVNNVMSQVQQQLPAGSRLAQKEWIAFNENNPNIDTDPQAIEKVFNFWTRQYQWNHAEQTSLAGYLKDGGDISQWPSKWQDIAQQKGFIVPNVTSVGGKPTTRPSIDSFFKQ